MIAADGASTTLASTTPPSLSQSNTFPSSNNPADSVGIMVQASIKAIRARLEFTCAEGISDVFGTGGWKRDSTFSRAYQEYASQVAQLDDNVSFYLKVRSLERFIG